MVDHAFPQPLSGQGQPALPRIRTIGTADLRAALLLGWDDFRTHPTQLFFLCIIYPVVALLFWKIAAGRGILALFYPMVSGFALIGPIAALGLYEISMRRERGQDASWRNCFDVLRSPSLGAVVALSMVLVTLFVIWLAIAHALYRMAFGEAPISTMTDLLGQLVTTFGGWFLIIVGNLVGLLFACAVLGISVVSFPMILDRNVDAVLAVRTSLAAVSRNRRVLALWGAIVGVLVGLGSALAFVGLAVILPVLGHATWHLYRRLIGQ